MAADTADSPWCHARVDTSEAQYGALAAVGHAEQRTPPDKRQIPHRRRPSRFNYI